MHVKNNINQGAFYIQGLRSFKDSLPKNVKKILNKRGHVYSEILNKWNYLVGKEISEASFPKAFKPNLKNDPGTLIMNVQRGNEILVEYSKNIIIKKINSYFGFKIINNIRIETFNRFVEKKNKKKATVSKNVQKKLLHSINEIENEKIKKSLKQLINAIQK